MNPKSSMKAIAFYTITFGLALLVGLAVPLIGEASLPVTMLTPAIAAILMLAFVAPEGSVRQALASLGLSRAGFDAWPLAVCGPAIIFGAGLLLLSVFGASAILPPSSAVNSFPVVLDVAAGLLVGTVFSLFEEVGWRGYLLPRMPVSDAWLAMLAVGFLHGLWHLPLMLTTDFYHGSGNPLIVTPMFLVTLTLAGGFYGYLRSWTASVWPVAIAHGAVNSAWNISDQLIVTKSPTAIEYVGGESGVVMIAALLVFNLFVRKRVQAAAANR